jgi:hypothetical protein
MDIILHEKAVLEYFIPELDNLRFPFGPLHERENLRKECSHHEQILIHSVLFDIRPFSV